MGVWDPSALDPFLGVEAGKRPYLSGFLGNCWCVIVCIRVCVRVGVQGVPTRDTF